MSSTVPSTVQGYLVKNSYQGNVKLGNLEDR